MQKFTEIEQFRSVIREVKSHHDYQGKDANGDAIYSHNSPYPTLSFRGTYKLHGTNAGICKTYTDEGVKYTFQSRENELSLEKDNAGFIRAMLSKDYDMLFCDIKFDRTCVIYGEWAGCFPYNTPILLWNGTTMPIGKIVNEELDVEVCSYNKITGNLEPKRIINWHKNGKTDSWLKIAVQRRKRGGRSTEFIVTPNHSIFLKENNLIIEKTAGEIKIGDKLLTQGKMLSYNTKQFLMGTLLGDGAFSSKRSISLSHSDDKQKHYNDFIEANMNNIFTVPTSSISGYGSNMRTFHSKTFPEIEDFYNELYIKSTKKQVTIEYLNKLSPLAFAVWYMDDGSIINHSGRQYRCSLHCQGFGTENVKLIESWFNSHGYYCNIINENIELGTEIRFNVDGSSAFLYLIAPYIINSFNYKLPSELRNVEKISWWNHHLNEYDNSLLEATVESVDDYHPISEHKKIKYDIEVEDNNNYFANRVLVHNSGIQKGVAIAQLPKMFVVFAIRIDGEYKDLENFKWIKNEKQEIYNILDFGCVNIDIDFNRPELVQNQIIDMTLAVEEECPVGKHFGVTGIGEGIVFEAFHNGERYIFKSKGVKHQNSKVKTLKPVDNDKISLCMSIAEQVTPEWRLEQMLEAACDFMNGGVLDRKHMGTYIKLVVSDVTKEDSDIIADAGLEMKDVGKYISENAKNYFFAQEKI